MCAIDWALLSAVIGALATLGLLIVAAFGFRRWRRQFIKTRDHDLARRMLQAISKSEIVFHELRTPHALFSDGEQAVEPPGPDDLPGQYKHRTMYLRYRARTKHLVNVRQERSALLFEAMALWDNDAYALRLGELVNALAAPENSVIAEATKHVEKLAPGGDSEDVNLAVLFAPLDPSAPDAIAEEYQSMKEQILHHLRPKLRME